MTMLPRQGAGRTPRRRALGELGLVAGGKLASLASLVLCNLLVARWTIDAGEYGRFAAALSLALILDAAIGFPVDISTVRFAALHPLEPARVDQLQAAAFRLKLLLGAGLLAVAALWGERLSQALLGRGAGSGLIAVALLCTAALLLVRSTAVRLQTQGRFARYAALDGFQGALRLLAITGPPLLGHRSAEAFLGAHAAATALAFIVGFWLLPQGYLRAAWPRRRDVREAAVHVGFMAGIVVLGTLTGRSDVPILASARSAEEAGHYAVALQVATLLTMLASYCCVVMQPRVIQMARAGRLGVLLRWNLFGATLLSAATAAMAPWVLPVLIPGLFGARYAPAVPIAAVLLIGTCADMFLMPVLMMFAIQVFPAVSLAGELLIALGFFGAVMAGAARTTMAMAWLVTGVRLAKLLLYSGITVADLKRPGDRTGDTEELTLGAPLDRTGF